MKEQKLSLLISCKAKYDVNTFDSVSKLQSLATITTIILSGLRKTGFCEGFYKIVTITLHFWLINTFYVRSKEVEHHSETSRRQRYIER